MTLGRPTGSARIPAVAIDVPPEPPAEITPPGSARPLEVLSVVRNNDNEQGAGVEFQARDMGGVHRIREVIRRIVDE